MTLNLTAGQPGAGGVFEANLTEDWTIGPKIHGGVMVALCAKAAREGYRLDGVSADPVAVSASFLSAPDPGPVRLHTSVRKRGRRIGLVEVELIQGDRACVRAVATLGEAEHDDEPLMSVHAAVRAMSLQPPAGTPAIGPGHPAAEINNLARGCWIHPQITESLGDGQAPMFRIWVRPRDEAIDEFFALMCGDISLPVSYAVGRRGWAPTVQLTAYLRGRPVDGWLRVLCTATQIGRDWFDADHTVIDARGRIVVQSRQLALVPGR
jgi:hypothetical protein